MEELAARLSSTAQRREDNNYLLAQLPVLLQVLRIDGAFIEP